MRISRVAGRILSLLGALLVLGACGKSGSSSGPSDPKNNQLLLELNAKVNDGRTVRWPTVPIPVFANEIASPGEVTEWTSASGGSVTFTFVGSQPGSGISFRFRSGTDICGVTTITFSSAGVISSAEVLVSRSVFRGPQCVRTVTHETGHAIGILEHTTDGGLMDEDGGNGQISGPVSQMLRDLYALPPGTLVGSSERPRFALRRPGERRTLTFVYPVRR